MDNKELIMKCAKELFYAKGYDAVGVQEIVDQAGVTKPTLYYYFGSKLGLLKTLLETKFEKFSVLSDIQEKKITDIRSALYELARGFCNFFEKDREFYMLMMALFYSARKNEAYQVVKPYVTEMYEDTVQLFEHFESSLGNMNGRQRQFAIGFIGTINHFLLVQYEIDPNYKEKVSEQQIISLVNQFMYGIFT